MNMALWHVVVHGLMLSLLLVAARCIALSDFANHLGQCGGGFVFDAVFILGLDILIFGLLLGRQRPRVFFSYLWAVLLFPVAVYVLAAVGYFFYLGTPLPFGLFVQGFRSIWPLLESEGNIAAAYWLLLVFSVPLTLTLPFVIVVRKWPADILMRRWERAWHALLGLMLVFPVVLAPFLLPEEVMKQKYTPMSFDALNQFSRLVRRETTTLAAGSSWSTQMELKPSWRFKPYNIVLINLESTSWEATSLSQRGYDTTPFLAQLGAEGVIVERVYAVVPWSTKAMVAIHCGFPPHLGNVIHEYKPGWLEGMCMPDLLGQLGYRSAFFQTPGSLYEGRAGLVDNMGFDHFVSFEDLDATRWEYVNSYFPALEDEALLDPILSWVDEGSEPFMVSVETATAHHPYRTPTDFQKDQYIGDQTRNDHLNAVRYTDGFVEKLHVALGERGLLDETLFVVMGDHGEDFEFRQLHGHGRSVYDRALRVPWVLWSKDLSKQPSVIEGLRQQTDLVPTVFDLLNVRVSEEGLYGRSVFDSAQVNDPVFFGCPWDVCVGKIQRDVKYIYNRLSNTFEMYDLSTDPKEKVDLAFTEVLDDRESLIQEFQAWKQLVNSHYERFLKAE